MPQRSRKTSSRRAAKRQLIGPAAVRVIGDALSGAVFDGSGKFRYSLWRRWDGELPRLCFIMLNPSTADDVYNDPTIARCVSFARRWQFGSLDVVNVFAYRATDSSRLSRVKDPVGPLNDEYILKAAASSDQIVLAWGNIARLDDRHAEVLDLLPECSNLYCFGTTKLGQPRHPLYVRNEAPLLRFIRRVPTKE
jgi:hypothetical protein